MPRHGSADHFHRNAADHHERAAHHHRKAAAHHASGRPAKAAHHAQVAHGHALFAGESANEASKQHSIAADGFRRKSHGPRDAYDHHEDDFGNDWGASNLNHREDEDEHYSSAPEADEDEDEDEDEKVRMPRQSQFSRPSSSTLRTVRGKKPKKIQARRTRAKKRDE